MRPRYRLTPFQVIKNLFPVKNEFVANYIAFSGVFTNKSFEFCMKGEMIQEIITESEIEPRIRTFNSVQQIEEEYNETNALVVTFMLNGNECGEEKLSEIQYRLERSEQNVERMLIANNVIYISPAQHTKSRQYFNSLFQEPELYEEFVKVMKMFDPGFISINLIDEESSLGAGNYVVLSRGHKQGILLDAYGDGMKKAMLLISAVLKAKDGILLLDEFETAIHISAMEHVFHFILQVAMKNNVQIFMTSHSLEAIETTLKCIPEYQKQMRMITLVKVEDEIRARNVDGEKAVQLLDEYGLELR